MLFDGIKNRHIIIFHIVLIMALNVLKGITEKWNYDWFIYVIPFFIMLIIYLCIKKSYRIDPVSFILCAVLCIIFGDWGNLSGSTFLIFSLYCTKYKTKILLILFAIIIMAIVTKFVFFMKEATILDTVMYCIGFEFIISIYYNTIHPKQKFTIEEDMTNARILGYMIQGLKNKEIADTIGLTYNAVAKRIESMRAKYRCGNNEQLIFKLMENGGIRQN